MYKVTWKDVWKGLICQSFLLAIVGYIMEGRGGALSLALLPFMFFAMWRFGHWIFS